MAAVTKGASTLNLVALKGARRLLLRFMSCKLCVNDFICATPGKTTSGGATMAFVCARATRADKGNGLGGGDEAAAAAAAVAVVGKGDDTANASGEVVVA